MKNKAKNKIKKCIIVILCFLMIICCAGFKKEFKQFVIYIDPGHGGIDGGCVGLDGTYEKDINLKISLELRDALINLGYLVEMTRVGDYDLASESSNNRKKDDIHKRCEMMQQGDIFISIHCNSFPNSSVKGAQVFYSDDEEKELALSIQNCIKEMSNNTKREINRITDKYILENINKRGCIVEVGFLSNQEDLKDLKNPDYQRNIGYAIAIGINQYLNDLMQ